MQKVIFTDEQINTIKQLYLEEGLTLSQVGERFNVSRGVITRICKEYNIPIKKDHHKYKADYHKFQNIDSSEKAYWLGFIAADGCVYERNTNASIIINLNRKDKEHLEKFKTFMNSNVNIIDFEQNEGFSNHTQMSKITFNSKDMARDLIDKKVTPRKSSTLEPPNIDSSFNLPFILGYFDGDGSLYKASQYNNYGLSIVGTKEMLTWINDNLNICNHLDQKDQGHANKNNYYIRCGGTNKPYKIMKQLYNSTEVHLDRKYEVFKNLETVVLSRNAK